MNYLTNYYKNLSEQLQAKVNNLESQVKLINESLTAYESDTGPVTSTNTTPAFNGAYLGQLLGQGNMAAVQQYLNQFNFGVQGPASALRTAKRTTSSRDIESAGQAAGEGRVTGDYNGDGRVDGADLGLALGSGQNVNSVVNNFTAPYSQSGLATLRSSSPTSTSGGKNKATVAGYAGAPGRNTTSVAGGAEGPGYQGPFVAGGAEGPGFQGPSVAGGAEGPGYQGPSVYGSAGGPGYQRPTVAGGAEGPAGRGTPSRGGFGNPESAGGPGRPETLPALSDLNGDGRVDGADLGLYMLQYGAVPPGYQSQQTQPAFGQPGGYTPPGIGSYSPSTTTRPGAGMRRRQV